MPARAQEILRQRRDDIQTRLVRLAALLDDGGLGESACSAHEATMSNLAVDLAGVEVTLAGTVPDEVPKDEKSSAGRARRGASDKKPKARAKDKAQVAESASSASSVPVTGSED